MRYGIFADIHGNLEALETVLEVLAREQIGQYLCVGDIVGYGANPGKCIHRLRQLNAFSVCGNHDWAGVGLFALSCFNLSAKQAVIWTQKQLLPEEREFLAALKPVYSNDILTLVHGTLDRPEEFQYIFNAYTARETLELTSTNICFVGHSHVPFVISKKRNDKIDYLFQPEIKISPKAVYVINAGSVGQPRDGDSRASFCIYDSERETVEIRRVNYDIRRAQEKIMDAGLPEIFARRLAEGR